MHYKNKKINRAILPGVFLAAAGLIAAVLPGRPLYAQEAVRLNTEGGLLSLSEYSQSTDFLIISSRTTNGSVSEMLSGYSNFNS